MSEPAFALWIAAIGATAFVVVLTSMTYWICKAVYKTKSLEHEERRLMIERGMIPPAPPPWGWPGVKTRELELKAEERRLLIEKGLQPGTEESTLNMLTQLLPKAEAPQPEKYLRSGLVKLAFGLGLAGAYGVFKSSGIDATSETQNWFLFFGVISPAVTLWGVANVVYYLAIRNSRREGDVSGRDPAR
jgi:hypothetical protein